MLFANSNRPQGGAHVAHDELVEAIKAKSCALIDVREPHEFHAGHVPGSVNMPLSRFDPEHLPAGKPIVLICRSGTRSASALARTRAAGRGDARHYVGGVLGWQRAGGELV
jgi:rhodanese-related sulfurtransferase